MSLQSLILSFFTIAIVILENGACQQSVPFLQATLCLRNLERKNRGTKVNQIKRKTNKEERYKAALTELRTQLDENQKYLNDITQEKGVSNWLKAYPISD